MAIRDRRRKFVAKLELRFRIGLLRKRKFKQCMMHIVQCVNCAFVLNDKSHKRVRLFIYCHRTSMTLMCPKIKRFHIRQFAHHTKCINKQRGCQWFYSRMNQHTWGAYIRLFDNAFITARILRESSLVVALHVNWCAIRLWEIPTDKIDNFNLTFMPGMQMHLYLIVHACIEVDYILIWVNPHAEIAVSLAGRLIECAWNCLSELAILFPTELSQNPEMHTTNHNISIQIHLQCARLW